MASEAVTPYRDPSGPTPLMRREFSFLPIPVGRGARPRALPSRPGGASANESRRTLPLVFAR